jgi:hypothetical protein
MPSLLGTQVALNYGKMTAQQTYGVGTVYSNFGTRQLRFVQIVATTDGSSAVNFSTNYNTSSLSNFAVAVRALQVAAEIYYINIPNSTGFVVAISEDTVNDSDSDTNVPGGYGDLEKAVADALKANGASAPTCTATLFTIAAA